MEEDEEEWDSDNYTVFTAGKCEWCTKVINLMGNLGLTFDVVSVKGNKEALTFMGERGLKTVPQVFRGLELIGGYEDFVIYTKQLNL
jgi:glutaredoxin